MPALSSANTKIARLWRGELDLPDAFWNWAVLGGLLVNMISSLLFIILLLNDQLIAAIIVGYGFSLPYNILVLIGVWRSAEHYEGDPKWAEYARMVMIIAVVLLSIT